MFLDLPSPWEAIESAAEALVEGGKLATFSPCVEQVHKSCQKLREHNFIDIKTIECLIRPYEVRTVNLEKLKFGNTTSPEQSIEPPQKRSRTQYEEPTKGESKDMMEIEEKTMGEEVKDNREDIQRPQGLQKVKNEIVGVCPFSRIRGHTGYLTFARKEVCWKE